MKFDVILTNPPFQDSVKRKKTPHKLWIAFTQAVFDRFLKEGGYLCQVSPASFGSPSNVVLEHMKKHRTISLRLDDEHYFPSVTSTFADYLIQKTADDGTPTQVFRRDQKVFTIRLDKSLKYLPNDLSRLSIAIHSKVMFGDRETLPVEWDYVAAHNIRRYGEDPTLAEEASPRFSHPVFHTNRSTWWSSVRQEWADSKKVMWSRSGYTRPFYDDGLLGGTDMAYFVRVQDRAAGETLAHNMNLALMRYIYQTARWSGFGNERVFASLPSLPVNERLSDDSLFRSFGLTDEEVKYVRGAVANSRKQDE